MELVVKNMRRRKETAVKPGFKAEITTRVCADEDVQFWWSTLCAITDVDNGIEEAILPRIVDLYVTIRGVAFATGWMEVLKDLQRSRGLRCNLQTPT